MELQFEHIQEVGTGNYPDLIHLWDNEANLLYIQDGRMRSKYAMTPNGEWEDREFIDDVDVSIDNNITHFRIDNMGGFGTVGSYKTRDVHKLIIYEYQFDLSEYLNSGNTKYSIDNPISSFTLSLENVLNPSKETENNIAIDEHAAKIAPGAKIIFKFGAGDEEADYEMGTFHVDRGGLTVLSETANVEGRNLIGKTLKDQTLDENYRIDLDYIHNIIRKFFVGSNLNPTQFSVQNSDIEAWFDFKPNMEVLSAIEEILKLTADWKVIETTDNRIIVGNPNYISSLIPNNTYTFHRNKDVFSRNIVRDDMGAYRRVCVHDSEFKLMVYRDVESYSGWNLQANKTLYVQVPDGTRRADAEEYADELASRLEKVGKIESFTGPIRPHLLCGDEAIIIDEKGNHSLGLITEIEHSFGKNGFYTNFAVDSGGKLGKGRITDFIRQITKGDAPEKKATTGYVEPEREYLGTLISLHIDDDTGIILDRFFSTGNEYGKWTAYAHAYDGYTLISPETQRVYLTEANPKETIYFYYKKDE